MQILRRDIPSKRNCTTCPASRFCEPVTARVPKFNEVATMNGRFTLDEVAYELRGVRIWHLDTRKP